MSLLKSLLSYAWPVTQWKGQGKYGPLAVVWEQGRLVVNSAHANQSFGNLHAIWQQCLEQQRVKSRPLRSILLLGFGAGSAARIIRNELGITAPITAVDGDPQILRIAREHFRSDHLRDLHLVEDDAHHFMQGHQARHDLVLVDLFHELDLAPGVDEEPFIHALCRCTAPGGLLCFNTIAHDASSTVRSQRTLRWMRHYFQDVEEHAYQGINRLFTATRPSAGNRSSSRPDPDI